MKLSNEGRALLREVEGFRAEPYLDAAGYWTVGIGHKIGKVKPAGKISEEQIKEWEDEDIEEAAMAVNNSVSVTLTQDQFDALVIFAFNIGASAFSSCGTIQQLNQGNTHEFFFRWIQWNKVTKNGVRIPDEGLVKRRIKEILFFLGIK